MADNIFEVELPGGQILEIEGAPNAEAARQRAHSYVQEQRRNAPRTGSSLSSGVDQLQGTLYSAVEGLGRATDIPILERFGREGRVRNEAEANAALPPEQRQSFEDAETVGDYARAAGQAIGTNLPNSALSLGGAAAGAAIGSAAGGIGAIPGALIGGLVASYPQLFGSNRQRQIQENPNQPVNEATAALTAIPQAALDTVSDRFLLGLGRVLGRPAAEVGRTLVPRLLRGLGVGVASEVPTEVLQQVLERAQAGLDLLSPEAFREYRETALATTASGGTTGMAISGVAGARPNAPVQTAPPEQQAPQSQPLQQIATLFPEEPEPIATVEDARQVLAANPEFAAPEGTSDEGLIVRANDVLRATYRDQVGRIRSETLADFTGSRDVITQPGEVDAEGNIGPDQTDVGRAAPTLVRNILDAQGAGRLEEGRFTANQVADLALERLGLTHSSLSRAERNNLSTYLNSLVTAGVLKRVGKSGFAIAEQEVRPQGRPGTAPPTAEQAVVGNVLNGLNEVRTNPTRQNMATALAAAKGTQLENDVANYLALTQQARILQVQANQLSRDNPANAEALSKLDGDLQSVAELQAEILDRLEGRAAGTLAGPDSRTGQTPSPAGYVAGTPVENVLAGNNEFTTQVGRSEPAIHPDQAATAAAVQAEQNARAQAGAETQRRALDERQIAEAINENPAQTEVLLRQMAATRKPGSRFDAQTIQQAAQQMGIPLSPQTAIQLYNLARMQGIVNRLGMLPGTERTTNAPASQPTVDSPVGSEIPIGGPQAQATWQNDARVDPTQLEQSAQTQDQTQSELDGHDSPAFMESEEDSAQARLDDERSQDETPQFAAPRLRNGIVNLPGFELNDDGTFDYTNEVTGKRGSGIVKLTGWIKDGVLHVRTANTIGKVKGEGFGVQAYKNLVDFAHSNGLDFASDIIVSDAASNVYFALKRRGYDVRRLPASEMIRSGDSWMSYDAMDFDNENVPPVYTIPAPYKFAAGRTDRTRSGPQTNLDTEVAREGGERAFRRVLGANGRLDIRDHVFLHDLGEHVVQAARDAGITVDTVEGVALGDLAILSMRDTTMPIQDVAVHEGFHVAENLGLFTPNELRLLNANLDKIRATILKYYPNAHPADLANPAEVRAYGLNARVAQNADFGSTINRIYDKFVNFLERIGNFVRGEGFQTWRDVYDAFNAGEMAQRSPTNPKYVTEAANFAAPRRVTPQNTTPQQIQQANVDRITGIMKWFGSPIMTMGKVDAALRPAADAQRTLYTRANEMIDGTEGQIEPAHKLAPPSVAKITRLWEQASRTRKAPDMSGLTAQERTALTGEMQAVQRGFDFMIESMTIDNFMPTADKSPAVRQRLENFWARRADKHLWEIPANELRAASPEGWQEMQKLERLRNPYYMPMVSNGTHFVAAYKRKPNGERGELQALVAYTPNNMLRSFRGFADPKADAIAQLQREFGNSNKYVIMQEGRQFTHDAEAHSVREQGDFVAKYMDRLKQASSNNQAALKVIADMTSQIDKAQMERIFRPNKDILRAVTPGNESSYILDNIPRYLLSMSKIQARRYTQAAYNEATKTLSPNDKAFLDNLRDYSTTPIEAFGNSRAAAFFMYLGGALDTAAINLTQNFNTHAFLVRDGGARGTAIFLNTAKQLMGSTSLKQFVPNSQVFLDHFKTTVPADERVAIERAQEQGVFSPVFTNESRSQFTVQGLQKTGLFKTPEGARGAQKLLTKLSQYAGLPMQWVEEYNRSVAFISAYRLAKENPQVITKANQIDGTDFKSAYDYAVNKVIDTQYLTTKEDRAYIQRFTPMAEIGTQFMSFPLKTMEQYIRAGAPIVEYALGKGDVTTAKAGAILLLGMAAPLIALGGVWALPMAESLRKFSEYLVNKVWGGKHNFDAELRDMLGAGQFAEAVVRGIPHASNMAALSRRVAVDPTSNVDLSNPFALFGPVGGLADVWANKVPQYYQNGDYWQLAAAIMPRAVGNVIRGMQLATDQEQYTLRGNRVITPQDVERVGTFSATVRQALGFPPPEFVNMRETVSMAEEVNRANRSEAEGYNKELTRYLVNMFDARRRGDTDGATAAMRQFGDRLREIMVKQDGRPPHERYNPNMSSLTRNAMADFYGIGSQEALQRRGRAPARPEVERRREQLDWRRQNN